MTKLRYVYDMDIFDIFPCFKSFRLNVYMGLCFHVVAYLSLLIISEYDVLAALFNIDVGASTNYVLEHHLFITMSIEARCRCRTGLFTDIR